MRTRSDLAGAGNLPLASPGRTRSPRWFMRCHIPMSNQGRRGGRTSPVPAARFRRPHGGTRVGGACDIASPHGARLCWSRTRPRGRARRLFHAGRWLRASGWRWPVRWPGGSPSGCSRPRGSSGPRRWRWRRRSWRPAPGRAAPRRPSSRCSWGRCCCPGGSPGSAGPAPAAPGTPAARALPELRHRAGLLLHPRFQGGCPGLPGGHDRARGGGKPCGRKGRGGAAAAGRPGQALPLLERALGALGGPELLSARAEARAALGDLAGGPGGPPHAHGALPPLPGGDGRGRELRGSSAPAVALTLDERLQRTRVFLDAGDAKVALAELDRSEADGLVP